MGDADFIIDEMGGFDSESGLPNFMNESASKSNSTPIKVKSPEESKKILEEMFPINERRELNRVDFSGLFINKRMGELFLFHKKITQKEFDEMTIKASKWQLTKEEYVEIVDRFTKEEWSKIFGSSK